jgi:uracil-DNA glycosylase
MAARDDILRELGLMPLWRLRPGAAAPASSDRDLASARLDTRTPAAVAEVATPSASPGDRVARIANLDWSDFGADIARCTACKLCRTRNKTVPGVGDPHAQWLFIGEGPGSEEDARGEPFVGQAGKLLDNMLAALALKRGCNVYIANVVKCRPPGNRAPEPDEAEACRPYLDRQIELIRPRVIVALGRSAATALAGVDASIASLRGRVHRYRDVALVVTYHPAYLLRNLPDKTKAWEDLLFARRTLVATRTRSEASER